MTKALVMSTKNAPTGSRMMTAIGAGP